VRITSEKPESFATLIHCDALSLVGLEWPVPHSESVKVLVPKWKKRAMPPSCHWSWKVVGRGKIGRGGGFWGQDAGTQKENLNWEIG